MKLRVLKIPELQNKLVGNLSSISPGTVWSSTQPGQSKELKCMCTHQFPVKGLGMSAALQMPQGTHRSRGLYAIILAMVDNFQLHALSART